MICLFKPICFDSSIFSSLTAFFARCALAIFNAAASFDDFPIFAFVLA